MRTTESGQSPLLLLDVLALLKKEHVDYAVIGAMAASFYGMVRASLDADAVIPLAGSPKDIEDARNAIAISRKRNHRPLLEKIAGRYGKKTLATVKSLL